MTYLQKKQKAMMSSLSYESSGYVKKGLLYQGVGSVDEIPLIDLSTGEFTIEICNEVVDGEYSPGVYKSQFRINRTIAPTDYQFNVGSTDSRRIMLYYTNGDRWVVSSKIPATYITVGNKRTSTFTYSKDNVKSVYFNGVFNQQRQASVTFGNGVQQYDNIHIVPDEKYPGLSAFNTFDFRVYNRVLTAEEIAQNFEMDKKLYGIAL